MFEKLSSICQSGYGPPYDYSPDYPREMAPGLRSSYASRIAQGSSLYHAQHYEPSFKVRLRSIIEVLRLVETLYQR